MMKTTSPLRYEVFVFLLLYSFNCYSDGKNNQTITASVFRDRMFTKEGTNLTLTCSGTRPWFLCVWEAPSSVRQCALSLPQVQSVCNDTRLEIGGNNENCTLQFNVMRSDHGKWTCVLTDRDEYTVSKMFIDLEVAVEPTLTLEMYSPQTYQISAEKSKSRLVGNGNFSGVINQTVILNCSAKSAHPRPQFTWILSKWKTRSNVRENCNYTLSGPKYSAVEFLPSEYFVNSHQELQLNLTKEHNNTQLVCIVRQYNPEGSLIFANSISTNVSVLEMAPYVHTRRLGMSYLLVVLIALISITGCCLFLFILPLFRKGDCVDGGSPRSSLLPRGVRSPESARASILSTISANLDRRQDLRDRYRDISRRSSRIQQPSEKMVLEPPGLVLPQLAELSQEECDSDEDQMGSSSFTRLQKTRQTRIIKSADSVRDGRHLEPADSNSRSADCLCDGNVDTQEGSEHLNVSTNIADNGSVGPLGLSADYLEGSSDYLGMVASDIVAVESPPKRQWENKKRSKLKPMQEAVINGIDHGFQQEPHNEPEGPAGVSWQKAVIPEIDLEADRKPDLNGSAGFPNEITPEDVESNQQSAELKSGSPDNYQQALRPTCKHGFPSLDRFPDFIAVLNEDGEYDEEERRSMFYCELGCFRLIDESEPEDV